YCQELVLQRVLPEPVISSVDCGRFSAGPCLRRGDPFSHPSGSSDWQHVRAIHPLLNRKGGRKATPLRLVFVGTLRIPRALAFVTCPVLHFLSSVPGCLICFHLPRLHRSLLAIK